VHEADKVGALVVVESTLASPEAAVGSHEPDDRHHAPNGYDDAEWFLTPYGLQCLRATDLDGTALDLA
jgi:hypothetical protein